MLLFTTVTLGMAYARTAVSPLQETMRLALGLSDNQMALLQGPALALPMIAAAVPLGLVIDRYSRVRLLLVLVIFNLLGSFLSAIAPNFGMLFAARCVVGLTTSAAAITVISLVADLYPPAQRGRAKAVIVVGQYSGLAAAFAFGGALLAVISVGPDAWRWVMFWLAVPLLPIALLMFAAREPTRTGMLMRNPSRRETFHELWAYRKIVLQIGRAHV